MTIFNGIARKVDNSAVDRVIALDKNTKQMLVSVEPAEDGSWSFDVPGDLDFYIGYFADDCKTKIQGPFRS